VSVCVCVWMRAAQGGAPNAQPPQRDSCARETTPRATPVGPPAKDRQPASSVLDTLTYMPCVVPQSVAMSHASCAAGGAQQNTPPLRLGGGLTFPS